MMEHSLIGAIVPRLRHSGKVISACTRVSASTRPKRKLWSVELLSLSTDGFSTSGTRRFSACSRPAVLLRASEQPGLSAKLSSRKLSLASAFRSVMKNRRQIEALPISSLQSNSPLYFVGSRSRTASARRLRDDDLDDNTSVTGNGGEQLKEWQVLASVCLERMPIVSVPLLSIEREFNSMLNNIERERSLLSDHELAHVSDAERLKQMAAEASSKPAADEEIVIETAKDREDKWNEQARKLSLAPRTPVVGQQNEQRSVLRRTDQKLYLVTKMQLGPSDTKWLFPHAAYDITRDGSLRETAERVVTQSFGDACLDKIQFLGNAPVGFYKYKYPKRSDARQQYMGAKVFFFHAQLLELNNNLFKLSPSDNRKSITAAAGSGAEGSPTVLDYMWLTRSEMEREMQLKYFQSIDKFLFEFALTRKHHHGSSADGEEGIEGDDAGRDISPSAMPYELARMRF